MYILYRDRLCFMKLPTAGVVFGWLHCVWDVIKVVILAVILIKLDKLSKSVHVDPIVPTLTAISFFKLALCIMDFIASVMLIIGTKKNLYLMLLPWLVINSITLVSTVILTFVLINVAATYNRHVHVPAVILITFGRFWVLTGIYSLFRSIRETKNQVLVCAEQNVSSSSPVNYELFKNQC